MKRTKAQENSLMKSITYSLLNTGRHDNTPSDIAHKYQMMKPEVKLVPCKPGSVFEDGYDIEDPYWFLKPNKQKQAT